AAGGPGVARGVRAAAWGAAGPAAEEPLDAVGLPAGPDAALTADRTAAGTAWPPEYGPEPPGPATPSPAGTGGANRAHEAPDGE
ncbi:DNA polymerase III subunit gamma and tau, partial [Streptomyces sp. PGLac3x]